MSLGSVALGALSIGHEYTNRTLTLLLSLPAARRRLYLVKLGVLGPMVLTLGALAFGLLLKPRALDRDLARIATIPLPVRDVRPVSGAVVDDDLPQPARRHHLRDRRYRGLIHIAGDIAGFAIYGFSPDARASRSPCSGGD